MATTETAILDALQELLEEEFKEFKWHLSNGGTPENSIPRGKLEKANRCDVVTLMVQQYRGSDAGKIAVRMLRKIKQNELADQLKGKLLEGTFWLLCLIYIYEYLILVDFEFISVSPSVPEDVSAEGGASSGAAAANTSTAGVKVTINASGGTVKAPVIHGGVFKGPMTFN